jgi:hypothetical protein
MNDNELDRLLDTWDAPTPAQSLRQGLRARFPRAERLGFARPLRWALAILLISVGLATTVALGVGMAQNIDSLGDSALVRILTQMYENFLEAREARRAASIVATIRQSEPKVYVDGRLVAPLEYGPAARMDVQVPGDGMYSIISYRFMKRQTADGRPTGWVEAGHIHGNVIEFQAGGKQVRIECNKPIVDRDRPVFATRRP